MRRACVLLLFFFCAASFAEKQTKTIQWVVVDFAPYYIMNDRYEGTGRDESVMKMIEKVDSNLSKDK